MNRTTPTIAGLLVVAVVILLTRCVQAEGRVLPSRAVTEWRFDQTNDQNYDDWPDEWRRRQGRLYPAYLPIQLTPKLPELMEAAIRADHQVAPLRRLVGWMGGPQEFLFSEQLVDRFLRIRLNGGGAVVQSPAVEVSDAYSYRVSGAIYTRDLKHNAAWIEYVFLDADGSPVRQRSSNPVSGTTPWTHVLMPRVEPQADAVQLVIQLHVEPQGDADIYGEIGFDNIRIERLPKLGLTTDRPDGLYEEHDQPIVTCKLSGLARPVTNLRFRLEDYQGNSLTRHQVSIGRPSSGSSAVQSLSKSWRLPELAAGFYRVHADLYDSGTLSHTTTATIAVTSPLPETKSPFGWTLSTGHDPIERRALPAFLQRCGVRWVKYPCWLRQDDADGSDELAWLLERFQQSGIQSIGMLDQPPSEARLHAESGARPPLAPLLRDPKDIRPHLEALITRLSMRTQWWQIGGEGDFSFAHDPNVTSSIEEIRRELQGFGQPIQVALPWPWLQPLPKETSAGWKAISLHIDQPLTAEELNTDRQIGDQETLAVERWITLDPLNRKRYSLDDRIRDLVARMIVVRQHGVRVAVISDPFDPRLAILNADATPGEMLLPWRTTAMLIGDLRHLGAMQLPERSSNLILSNGKRSVMVVWNSAPTEERLYLGEDVRQIDVWGRATPLSVDSGGRSVVPVGQVPTFIIGIDPELAAFRVAAKLENARLDSVPGRKQVLGLQLSSPSGIALSGAVKVNAPITWDTRQDGIEISPRGGGDQRIPIEVSLRSNAPIGRDLVRFDFDIDLSRRYRFSIWRDVDVGPKDIVFDPNSRFDDNGNLIITVSLTNESSTTQDFNCYMLTQSQSRKHQRQRMRVPPRQWISRDFVWPRGDELRGSTLTLQAEDRHSRRVLNYPIPIDR